MADVTLDCENATISKQIKVAGCNGVYTMMENISQLAWVNQTSKTTYLLRTNAMDEETLILIAGEFMEKILK